MTKDFQPPTLTLSDRLRARTEREQAEIEKIMRDALLKLGRGFEPVWKAALVSIENELRNGMSASSKRCVSDIEKMISPALEKLSTVSRSALLAEKRLRSLLAWGALSLIGMAAFSVGALACLYWINMAGHTLQAQITVLQHQISEAQTTLQMLANQTWGVGFLESSNGRFVTLPSNAESGWTCSAKPCLRLK